MTDAASRRQGIENKLADTRKRLLSHLDRGDNLAVVSAPPGSGKTYLLLQAVAHVVKAGARVAVAAQTNTQVEDICRRLAAGYPKVKTIRFAASGAIRPKDLPKAVDWVTETAGLPSKPSVVVGTAAKWGLVNITSAFDYVFVEEAWQLSWADFMLLAQVASRFVLIGDPGQIAPVVSIDVSRWQTSPRPPHDPAPEVILRDDSLPALRLSLPATRRLPHDTAAMIQSFYEFPFASWAGPGDRAVHPGKTGKQPIDRAIDLLDSGATSAFLLPTPAGGPPLEEDEEVAATAVSVVERLLEREAVVEIDGKNVPIEPSQIGLCATHRVMNGAMELGLPRKLRGQVRVDTPERWQGLERHVMVIVHPLSGVTNPSSFDLDTGRLCVMASRHMAGLVIVSRDHLAETLDEYLPTAEQAVGRLDVTGRGHYQNLEFWGALESGGRIVSA